MALEPERDPLERARAAAQEAPPPEGWIELSESVMSRVRRSVTPSEPILAFTDAGGIDQDDAGSRTRIAARIVSTQLRRTLQQPTHAPEDIDLVVVDERLQRVSVRLVCSYGVDLVALATRARQDVYDVVRGLLGPDPEFTPASVSIEIVDVVVGDPNVV